MIDTHFQSPKCQIALGVKLSYNLKRSRVENFQEQSVFLEYADIKKFAWPPTEIIRLYPARSISMPETYNQNALFLKFSTRLLLTL